MALFYREFHSASEYVAFSKNEFGSWGQINRRVRKIRVIFMKENFKNSYLPVCAHSRISSGTKVDQLEELYKISWKTPTLTHITLVNTVRVYRVTSGNFFPPKLISKNFIFIFTLFSYSRSTK